MAGVGVAIRPARGGQLPDLVRAFGQQGYFADRLARQRAGAGRLLVAWLDTAPAGHAFLWTGPAPEPELRRYLPAVPTLNGIAVHPALRGRGIGGALLGRAHRELARAGHRRVALLVGTDNPAAARLYRRLGYRAWRYGQVTAVIECYRPDGTVHRAPLVCRVLTRQLD